VAAIEQHVVTSIPSRALPDLIELLPALDPESVTTLGLGPPTYRGPGHVPEVELIRQRVRHLLDDPKEAVSQSEDLQVGEAVCR